MLRGVGDVKARYQGDFVGPGAGNGYLPRAVSFRDGRADLRAVEHNGDVDTLHRLACLVVDPLQLAPDGRVLGGCRTCEDS
jgi:hypothetical protein